MGLNHRGADPSDRHPLGVVLQVLVPSSPGVLDCGGRGVLRLHRMVSADRKPGHLGMGLMGLEPSPRSLDSQ